MIELVARPSSPAQPLLVESFAIVGAGSASPVIDRVPFEIWQQIFLLLLSSEDVPGLDEIFGPIWGRTTPPASIHGKLILPQSPTTISQVCSSWREYAFGMPDLWNMLFVKAPSKRLSSSASKLAVLVERRLVLTRSMPLKLCVYSKDDEESAHTLLGAVLPFSSRWETIHLHIPPLSMSELFSLRQSDLPLLNSLKIHMQIYALGTIKSRQLSVFDNVPPIQRLCTSYLPPPTCPIYAALEELHIQEGRSETWSTLRVLAACPQLRVLTLSGVGITMASAAPSAVYPDLVLTELHALNLEHPTGRERLLDMLKLPKLRALTIGGSCSGESTSSVFSAIMMLMDRRRAPRTPSNSNNAANASAFSAVVRSAGSPIASLFTPRAVSSGRSGPSGSRQTRNHRKYSIDLSHVPVHSNEETDPSSKTSIENPLEPGVLDTPKPSLFIDRGSPLDTVRLARRRSKAARNSKGNSPLLVPPQRPAVSPHSDARTSYPLLNAGPVMPEPLARSDAGISHSSLWAPPAYRSRSGTTRTIRNGSLRSPPDIPLHGDHALEKPPLHRAAEILQQATRRVLEDPAFSQSSLFRYLAPLVIFLSLLLLVAAIPRFCPLEGRLLSDLPCVILLVIAGVTSALVALRCLIWLVGIFATRFCETDLSELSRKRGMTDANGMRLADGDMVTALF
ncbi:hypothetical protein CVT26_012226 [Gymnopilus dilepis]|uniref:F-box domain-containing protein n=1 Tax=Gymnopilus dilepis TaxID=231916 RepID=A0A409YQ66_9AGAR|nr:hypothetical protein CVT26_012226 [Gymnopilus dilepis]